MHSSTTEKHILALLENYITNKKTIEALYRAKENAPGVCYDEMIEKMAFALPDNLGVSPGYVSDRTSYIALNYGWKTYEANKESTSDIVDKLMTLESDCGELEFLVAYLMDKQREVIRMRYFEGKDRKSVCNEIGIAPRTYDKYRREAIDRLCELYEMASKFRKR